MTSPIPPSTVFKTLPTRRTVAKSGRDILAATVGFCIAYTVSTMAGLDLSPEAQTAIGPFATFLYRIYRGWTGAEPVEFQP